MATGRLAVLSNVNMNMVIRMLQKQAEVYDAEGYGNELGVLLNPASSYHAFQPDITFLIMDLAELLEHDYDPQTAKERIGNWFQTLEGCLPEHGVFYVSDAYLWAVELAVLADPERKQQLESLWSAALQQLTEKYSNVRIFPYRWIIEHQGEEKAFSLKCGIWESIAGDGDPVSSGGKILQQAELEERTPKRCWSWIWTIPCGAVWPERRITHRCFCRKTTVVWLIKICNGS